MIKKNPKKIIKYTSNGKQVVNNPRYDPRKCEYCGKKHGFLQTKCRKEDL